MVHPKPKKGASGQNESRLSEILRNEGPSALAMESPNPVLPSMKKLLNATDIPEMDRILNLCDRAGLRTFDETGTLRAAPLVDFLNRVFSGIPLEDSGECQIMNFVNKIADATEQVQNSSVGTSHSQLYSLHAMPSRVARPNVYAPEAIPKRPVMLGSGNFDDLLKSQSKKARHKKTTHLTSTVLCDPYVHMEGAFPETDTLRVNELCYIDEKKLTEEDTFLSNNTWTVLPSTHVATEARGVHIFPDLEAACNQGLCVKRGEDSYLPSEKITWGSFVGSRLESMKLERFSCLYRYRDQIAGYIFPPISLSLKDWFVSHDRHDFKAHSGIFQASTQTVHLARQSGYELIHKTDGRLIMVYIFDGVATLFTRGFNYYYTCQIADPDLEALFRFEAVFNKDRVNLTLLLSEVQGQMIPELQTVQQAFCESLTLDVFLPVIASNLDPNYENYDIFSRDGLIISGEVPVSLDVARTVNAETYDVEAEGLCIRPLDGSGSSYVKQHTRVTLDLDYKLVMSLRKSISSMVLIVDDAIQDFMGACNAKGVDYTQVVGEFALKGIPIAEDDSHVDTLIKNPKLNPKRLRALRRKKERDTVRKRDNTASANVYNLRFIGLRPDKRWADSLVKIQNSLSWVSLDFLLH